MERRSYEMSMLFDFYGDLLSERQREIFDLYYNDDLSLGEIAENAGISRQGVRDSLVRAEAMLTDFEEKTGSIARFQVVQQQAEAIVAAAEEILTANKIYQDRQIERLAQQIRQTALRIKE